MIKPLLFTLVYKNTRCVATFMKGKVVISLIDCKAVFSRKTNHIRFRKEATFKIILSYITLYESGNMRLTKTEKYQLINLLIATRRWAMY